MSLQIARHHFTVSEYYRMAEAGIFTEDDRVELIEGEIIEMSPVGSRHSACVARLIRLFSRCIGDSIILNAQNPVRLDDYSEPEPDVALLRARDDFYASEHPGPADTLLLVEVAETSLGYDRQIKVPLYAKAGVPEVWVVDLRQATVTRHARPFEAAYQDVQICKHGESITSHTANLTLDVDAILG